MNAETVAVTDVIVGERARKEYGDLSDLMASIREHGMLQPIGLAPGNHLLFGGRRLEAVRRLGNAEIAVTRPSTQTDALSLLRAERDENTCRKDMTPEELVDLGMRLEEMERPKAEARKAEGQQRGAEVRWGLDASGSPEPQASEAGGPSRTARVVGDALGMPASTYKRAKHVVTAARDEAAEPEVREAATEALESMNAGEATISGAYNRVQQARKLVHPEPKAPTLTRPQPPRYGGNRRKHAQIIGSISTSLSGLAMAAEEITEFDNSVTAEEAVRLADDLSVSIRSLNRLKHNLNRKATS